MAVNQQEIIKYFLVNLIIRIINCWGVVTIGDVTVKVIIIVFIAKVTIVVKILKLKHLDLYNSKNMVITIVLILITNWLWFVITTIEKQNLRFIKVRMN